MGSGYNTMVRAPVCQHRKWRVRILPGAGVFLHLPFLFTTLHLLSGVFFIRFLKEAHLYFCCKLLAQLPRAKQVLKADTDHIPPQNLPHVPRASSPLSVLHIPRLENFEKK